MLPAQFRQISFVPVRPRHPTYSPRRLPRAPDPSPQPSSLVHQCAGYKLGTTRGSQDSWRIELKSTARLDPVFWILERRQAA
jgi:hypothetical protein